MVKPVTRRPRQRAKPDVAEMIKGAMNGDADPKARAHDASGRFVSRETQAEPQPEAPQMARPDPRGDMRGEMRAAPGREETSRERAERRTAEIMDHLEGALDEGPDELALEGLRIPDGWTYEWKRQTVYGKADPAYDTRLARTGWETVPADRHPQMMPKGHRGEITRDGLVLMERPKAITDRVKQIMFKRAKDAVRNKERSLNEAPQGTFERVDEGGRPTARVRTSYSPVQIPVPDA